MDELRVYCVVFSPVALSAEQWDGYYQAAITLGMGAGVNAVAEAAHERVWNLPIRLDGRAMVIDFEIAPHHRVELRAALETAIAPFPPQAIAAAIAPTEDARKMAALMTVEAQTIMSAPSAYVAIIGYGARDDAIQAARAYLAEHAADWYTDNE
jgi:hypothetical protein